MERGQIHFTVIKAKDIEKKGKFGKADPYVKLTYGKQKAKSKTIKNNHNPEWNFEATFDIDENSAEGVNIAVFDDDFGKDDSLGNKTMDIVVIQEKQKLLNQWITLENCKSGEVLLSAEFIPLASVQKGEYIAKPVDSKSSEEDKKQIEPKISETIEVQDSKVVKQVIEESKTTKESKTEIEAKTKEFDKELVQDLKKAESGSVSKLDKKGIKKHLYGEINITIHKAREIENKGGIGNVDSYVILTLGDESFQSETKKSKTPEWDFNSKICIDHNSPNQLKIEIYDNEFGKDDCLGNKTLNIHDIIKQRHMTQEWIKLEGCKSGEIFLSLIFIPAEISEKTLEAELLEKQLNKRIDSSSLQDSTNTVLLFTLTRASNLEKTDYMGKSDPYAVIHYKGKSFRSQTINNDLNPNWNFSVSLDILKEDPGEIIIQIYDADYDGNDEIGNTIIKVSDLLACNIITEKCIKLENCKSGEVTFSSSVSMNDHKEELVDETKKQINTNLKTLKCGRLDFKLIGAKNLENADYIGKSDPYALVEYKKEEYKTKTISNNLNPVWNMSLVFNVEVDDPGEINIKVFDEDYNGDDEIGKTSIKVAELIASKTIDLKTQKLEECQSGEIHFSSYYSTIIKDEGNMNLKEEMDTKKLSKVKTEELKEVDVNKKEIVLPQKTEFSSEPTALKASRVKSNILTKPIKTGSLHLTFVCAKNLENADYIGKSDPYVIVTYRDQTFRSETVSNNLNPVWNFSITLEIIETDSGIIYVQVYDEDYNGDDEIGKATIIVQDLIDSKDVDGKWIKLQECKSGELQISSSYVQNKEQESKEELEEEVFVTGKLEFDLKTAQPKFDITESKEKQTKTMPSYDYSQNFDKVVKKSCKKIIRRMDASGNITEEVVEEGKPPENWETSTLDMSSGIQVVTGQSKTTSIKKSIDEFGNVISEDVQTSFNTDPNIDFEELYKAGFSAIPIKKTSVTTTKRIIRKMDEEGNIIEESYEGDDVDTTPEFDIEGSLTGSMTRSSTQTSRKIIKRFDEDGNIIEETITESDGYPVEKSPTNIYLGDFDGSSLSEIITSRKSVSSKKITKIVDSEGNVIETTTTEGRPDFSMSEDQLMSSIPITSRHSVTSTRTIKMIDSEGNVTEKTLGDGEAEDIGFDSDKFRKYFTSSEHKPTETRKILRTVDNDGNVTEETLSEDDLAGAIPVAVRRTSVKTTRKIVRNIDEYGNITEETIDEPTTETSKWEQVTNDQDVKNMTYTTVNKTIDEDGKVVNIKTTVGQPEDLTKMISMDSNLPTAVKRTSIKSTKMITRHFDEDGNVTEEIVNDENPLIESELWEKSSMDIPTTLQVTSCTTSLTTIKRTVDEHGNIIDEEVSTVESKDPHSQMEILEDRQSDSNQFNSKSQEGMTIQENGKLILILHNAKDLENKDWVGKSDPYAVVTLGQTVYKTKTITNNLNPEFEQKMEFDINETSPSSLNIEIFDEDITRDDCLGNTAIDITLVKKERNLINQLRNLSNSKSGKICYSIEFIPEVKDEFCDSNAACSQIVPRKLKPIQEIKHDNENKDALLLRMSDLGVENIELIPEESNKSEDVLLKDVIDLQASTKKKISGLMKTIQKVELDASGGIPQIHSRKIIKRIDSEGNVIEEIIDGDGYDSSNLQFGDEQQINSSITFNQNIVRKTVKIMDNQGNIIEEKDIDTTGDGIDLGILQNTSSTSRIRKLLLDHQGNVLDQENKNVDNSGANSQHSLISTPVKSTTSYVIRKEFSSESEKSPTFEDITYSEYPHLTTPMDPSFDVLSSPFATQSHSVRYFHSSSEPFQNITSLRAHFVHAFDEDVPDAKSTEYDLGAKDVKFDDTFSNYSESSSYNINRSVSRSTQLFSSTHSFSGSEFSSNKSTCMEVTGKLPDIDSSAMYMLASEEPSLEEFGSESGVTTWMEPVISGNCITDKEFWKTQANSLPSEAIETPAFFANSSHSSSPDHSLKSGPHSLRSPVSVLKEKSPVLFQSLPSSPKKKNSVKNIVTSELFSSDKDISRSLELVYTEPHEDPKEKLSSIYKSVAPLKHNVVERKPSFTKIKRPSIEYDIPSGSSSPEWRVVEGKSIDFSPCNSSHEYSFQKMSIPISSSSSPECQISKDICSKDPPCIQLFDPKSQSSVRSPERKFQYVQGNRGITGTCFT